MKKLIIATALTAMAVTAQAQNVTVYGVADAGMRMDSAANSSNNDKYSMVSGVQSTSRVGFRGTEDIGNGLSAKFTLETGISPTTGANSQNGSTGTVLFDRAAWVGLADKSAGEVQLGRNTNATYDLAAQGITDPLSLALDGVSTPVTVSNGTYNVSSLRVNQVNNAVASSNGYKNSRADSMIKYLNSFGPVNVIAGYAPGGVAGDTGQKSSYTLGGSFKMSGVALGAAQTRSTDASDKDATTRSIGGSYTLGNATLSLAQHKNKTDAGYVATNLTTTSTYAGPVMGTTATSGPATDSKINVIGAKYAFSPKFITTVAYNKGTYTNDAGKEGNLKSVIVMNEYYLSKRTNLYGFVDHVKAEGDITSGSVSSSNTGITAGIRHMF